MPFSNCSHCGLGVPASQTPIKWQRLFNSNVMNSWGVTKKKSQHDLVEVWSINLADMYCTCASLSWALHHHQLCCSLTVLCINASTERALVCREQFHGIVIKCFIAGHQSLVLVYSMSHDMLRCHTWTRSTQTTVGDDGGVSIVSQCRPFEKNSVRKLLSEWWSYISWLSWSLLIGCCSLKMNRTQTILNHVRRRITVRCRHANQQTKPKELLSILKWKAPHMQSVPPKVSNLDTSDDVTFSTCTLEQTLTKSARRSLLLHPQKHIDHTYHLYTRFWPYLAEIKAGLRV